MSERAAAFFDLDKTLYAYDFRRRLPALAVLTGASQYHLARTWWADGYEARAEAVAQRAEGFGEAHGGWVWRAGGEGQRFAGARQILEGTGDRQVAGQPRVALSHVYGAPGLSGCTVLTR